MSSWESRPLLFWPYAARASSGLGTALWHPPAAASLSNRFPESRAMALAVHGMGATVSDTLTPLAVGALLVALQWQDFLTLQFIPALFAGFVVWRSLTHLFSAEETHASRSTQIREILQLARHPVFLGISAAKGLAMMGRLVVMTFLPIYLQEHRAIRLSPWVSLSRCSMQWARFLNRFWASCRIASAARSCCFRPSSCKEHYSCSWEWSRRALRSAS